MIKTSRQLKDFIKNKSKEIGLPNNSILQTYMLEKLIERLSLSNHKDKFVIKGRDVNIIYCWTKFKNDC